MTTQDCSCADCSWGCSNRPGWLKPGQAEKVAEFLGISLEELFRTRLNVDWWSDDINGATFLLVPSSDKSIPGQEYPADPHGRCTFLATDGKCEIHEVKPFECRMAHCRTTYEESQATRSEVVSEWKAHQEQIKQLLGREPEESRPGMLDLFGLLGELI